MVPISPLATLAAVAAGILAALEWLGVPALRAIATHWFLFLPGLVVVMGMAGVIGRGFGLHNISHEDPELAARYGAGHGWGIHRNSPAIFGQAALAASLVHVWGFAFTLGIDGVPDRTLAAAAPEIGTAVALSALLGLVCGAVPVNRAVTGPRQPGEGWRSLLGAGLGVVAAWGMLWLAIRIEPLAGALLGPWADGDTVALGIPGVLICAALLGYPKLLPAIALSALGTLLLLGYAAVSMLPDSWQFGALLALGGWLVLANGVIDRLRHGEARLKFEVPGIVDPGGQSHYLPGRQLDLRALYPDSAEATDIARFRADQRARAPETQTDPDEAFAAKPGRVAPLAALAAWRARTAPPPLQPPERIDGTALTEAGLDAGVVGEALARARAFGSASAQDAEDQSRRPRPKLVLITTSGGAYRASFWTGIVLDALSTLERTGAQPGFAANVRLITGASGGMVGGAYFAAMAGPGSGAQGSVCARIESDILAVQDASGPFAGRYPHPTRFPIPRDSLSAVAQRLVQRDLPGLLRPGVSRIDRGTVLEDQWATLDCSFADLRQGEADGWRPSLILSPMLAETGQPLLISNLDMDLVRRDAYGETVQFFDWFPAAQATFRVKTAVRLNAAFPYIAPAAALPTRPYRRVVDAGYYDNYGVDLAATYLARPEIRDWVLDNTSGVIVIQLRAFPFTLPLTAQAGAVGRALQWLTTPVEAMLAARGSTMTFRNRQSLRQVRLDYRDRAWPDRPAFARPDFVESLSFEVDSQTSLNWYLPGREVAEMRRAFRAEAMQKIVAALVEAWWR
ncbi:hypothetical protein M1105_08370 [Limibaculum sp. FT325]|uniref:hypothetical protein n=1 Tax=Thermohalobaculum sediminis TaxID=2939436 RepID=UPI0020BFA0C8|nr:hypothetical protein [Limibaculum sediminis]MCL5776996.1 hypothetical protein [Limibaculum sediminis]